MRSLEQDVDLVLVDGPGFTEVDAYAFLAGIGRNTSTLKIPRPLTAAANAGHTGAMIALVPSDTDAKRLRVRGGEAQDQLHLTLLYLGEADAIDEAARTKIIDGVTRIADAFAPIEAQGFSINVFNPTGDEPCLVLGVGNGGPELEDVHRSITSAVRGASVTYPENHTPWIPHVTLAYTDDLAMVKKIAGRTGPVTFDHIRVAFAGDVTDIPLGGETEVFMNDDEATEVMTSAAIAGDIMRALASDRGLRNYWTRGGGAAKIRWGTDGSFNRCVRLLGKHVTRPQGLCAEYHKEATGESPAEKGVESAMTTPLVAHGHHNQQDHNPHKGFHVPDADTGYSDAFDAPTRSGSAKRLRQLEDQLEGDEGLSDAEKAELAQLRRIMDDDYDGGDFALHPLIAAARREKKQEYADEPWSGILAIEGTESGDSRLFNLGSLDWAPLPQPLMYQPASVGGHTASVVAGEITQISRRGSEIAGVGHIYGNMLAGEHGDGIRNMMKAGGVSVDVDKVKDADVEEIFTDDSEGGLFAKPDITVFNRGRIRGATLVAFPAFVEAKLAFGNVVTASSEPCACGGGIIVASGHTITIPDLPPAEWFQKPTDVKMYGAVTITDEGRMFGWIAPSQTTHRSVRKQVPMGGKVDYSRWMNKETIVAGGGRIKTGVLTMNCGHAETDPRFYGTLENRKQHYDNTCSIFANAVIGEEPGKGVWFAGAVRHGVTADQLTAAMGSSLSGDWQPHPDRPGVQEFIAALLVPVPGFPMARSRPSVELQDGVITASVVPVRFASAEPRSEEDFALEALDGVKLSIMEGLGLDPDSVKRQVMAEIEGLSV